MFSRQENHTTMILAEMSINKINSFLVQDYRFLYYVPICRYIVIFERYFPNV